MWDGKEGNNHADYLQLSKNILLKVSVATTGNIKSYSKCPLNISSTCLKKAGIASWEAVIFPKRKRKIFLLPVNANIEKYKLITNKRENIIRKMEGIRVLVNFPSSSTRWLHEPRRVT